MIEIRSIKHAVSCRPRVSDDNPATPSPTARALITQLPLYLQPLLDDIDRGHHRLVDHRGKGRRCRGDGRVVPASEVPTPGLLGHLINSEMERMGRPKGFCERQVTENTGKSWRGKESIEEERLSDPLTLPPPRQPPHPCTALLCPRALKLLQELLLLTCDATVDMNMGEDRQRLCDPPLMSPKDSHRLYGRGSYSLSRLA